MYRVWPTLGVSGRRNDRIFALQNLMAENSITAVRMEFQIDISSISGQGVSVLNAVLCRMLYIQSRFVRRRCAGAGQKRRNAK